uniref:Non-haem dioxygenase N-terminal domain-containing protein n=1 Tax=Ciona intestinalis TaxID=7719 RepID=H2Y356_CIOIN
MLPIIDFKQCRPDVEVSDKEINETGQANGGCFVHSRFCISKELWNKKRNCRRTRNTADEIFNAPTDKKNIYKRNPITTFGYIGFSTEKVDPALPVDYKEAFNVPGCALDPSVGAKWPHELSPNFAPLTKSFMEECKSLALIILEVIAVGLQIKDRHVLQNAHQHLNLKHSLGGALKYLYYPPIKEDVKPEQKRLGEHSDWGSITLLFVDNTGGLQVFR